MEKGESHLMMEFLNVVISLKTVFKQILTCRDVYIYPYDLT